MKGNCDRIQQAKLVILGAQVSGKSSLVLRFVKGQFDNYQVITIGAASLTKTFPEQNVKLDIWDTGGATRYHAIAQKAYRDAEAAVTVFDVTSKDSFATAKCWIKELQHQVWPAMGIKSKCSTVCTICVTRERHLTPMTLSQEKVGQGVKLQGKRDMVMALAGNKVDMEAARIVTKEEAQTYAAENSLTYWETSAKANINVTELFHSIAECLSKAV